MIEAHMIEAQMIEAHIVLTAMQSQRDIHKGNLKKTREKQREKQREREGGGERKGGREKVAPLSLPEGQVECW